LVLRDRERATELRKAIASFCTAARQTEPTMGHLIGKPETGAGITIVKLNRHLDIDLSGPETVQLFLFRLANSPESKRCTAAKKESKSIGQRPPALDLALRLPGQRLPPSRSIDAG
jgi:hypothetical protein